MSYSPLQKTKTTDYNGDQHMKINLLMPSSQFSIVLIDESEIIASRLKSLLAGIAGFKLLAHAHNISEGYLIFRNETPDLVLLDSWLPDGTGISMLRELKNKYSGIKIIILSNSGSQYYKDKCLELGATAVLDKSSDLPEFQEILLKLLNS